MSVEVGADLGVKGAVQTVVCAEEDCAAEDGMDAFYPSKLSLFMRTVDPPQQTADHAPGAGAWIMFVSDVAGPSSTTVILG